MVLSLPAEKIKKIRAEARRMAKQTGISARELSRLLGKMKDAANVIPVAPLFYCLTRPLTGEQRGIGVVRQPHEELEWENPLEERDRPGNRLRRIPQGMGSSLPGPEDWRSLVNRGREYAHQLSGAACSNFGSPCRLSRKTGQVSQCC